jgi:N-acetylneuraminic acid mutarotase
MKPVSIFPILCVVLLLCLPIACSIDAPSSPTQSPGPQGSWSSKATLPVKLSEVTVAAAGGKVYVLGGTTPDGVDQRLNQEYDPAMDRWRERAPLPRAINHAGATGLNGKIYVVGAFTQPGHGAAINSVFEYDPATDAWRTLAPLKSPRGSVGVTVLDGKIHAIGGRGTDKVTVATHEVYDLATGKWSELAPLPKARDHLAVVAAAGRIHAIGGRLDASSQNVDLHDIYNPATNSWQSGAALPTARSGVAGALYQNMIIVAGGECRDKHTYNENEGYDFKAGRWSTLAPLPAGRHGFAAVAVGPSLYFAAGALGCGGGERSDQLLAFNLP